MNGPLLRLTIEGVGLIDRADVVFADGFTVVTGETGSGKSMLLGALEFALGGRVERELVRGERARVTLEVAASAALRERLQADGITLDADEDVVIVREVGAAGRTGARVNGTAVSAGQLRAYGADLLDLVGQGEAQRFLEPSFARELLDRFGGERCAELRSQVHVAYDAWKQLEAECERLTSGTEQVLAERAFAEYALAEIDAVAVVDVGEDQRLRERRDALANAEQIVAVLARARAALEDDGGAVDALGSAARGVGGLVRYGEAYAEVASRAAALQAETTLVASELARAMEQIESDPQTLATLEDRLDALESLKRKYGGSLAAVLDARERFAGALETDADRDERRRRCERELEVAQRALQSVAIALSAERAALAARATEAVGVELRGLAMPAARFAIAVSPLDEIASHGADRVELRFSANPGEPERPLAKVASGGERSRVLLAVVLALAAGEDGRTFVFDEIDAGIGGAAASAVGVRLARLARRAQVICVTHLAQIAARADEHYALRKREEEGRTVIEVDPLDVPSRRLEEIARMLSGEISPISLEHAASLLASSSAVCTS
jgi:DNA repair protein RecN (Recombination protein N)